MEHRTESIEERAGAGDRARVEKRQQEFGIVGLERLKSSSSRT
jgi:hypothetical protein